ncbi:hypothetical protein RIR_jg32276.t1 [Rhizophagus irregularis DAOM 181602=DAOM 197198]|nr:hypothetical protein RIR_jg32276.t1 [Rhizophagus irregularis DAOM 181602=DAOM 197198]
MITDEKERNIITDMEELCIMDKSERNIITDIEELNISERNIITDIEELNISERNIITDMEELNISERNIITDMKKQKCEGEDHVSSVTILVQIFISKLVWCIETELLFPLLEWYRLPTHYEESGVPSFD